MSPFAGEFIGTALLIIMGDGVVANVVLNKTKGNNSGWIVIAFGWAMAVFIGVYASNRFGGGGHLNPAVTLASAVFGDFDPSLVGTYIAAQFAGAIGGTHGYPLSARSPAACWQRGCLNFLTRKAA